MSPNRENTTEMFLTAQGYARDRILKAISVLSGETRETTDTDSPLLTPKELCKMLRISLTSLWRLKPPHIVIGARKRYQLAEVKEFLAERREENAESTAATLVGLTGQRQL
jgi:hypothetical protein